MCDRVVSQCCRCCLQECLVFVIGKLLKVLFIDEADIGSNHVNISLDHQQKQWERLLWILSRIHFLSSGIDFIYVQILKSQPRYETSESYTSCAWAWTWSYSVLDPHIDHGLPKSVHDSIDIIFIGILGAWDFSDE